MVYLTRLLAFATKKHKRAFLKGSFIDTLRLRVKGGGGGMGLAKYGGIGGRGGHVYVVAKEKETLHSLQAAWPKKEIYGGTGIGSRAGHLNGEPGDDKYIHVPVGVNVIDEKGVLLGELLKDGDEVVVARGGYGGCPDSDFEAGRGQEKNIRIDLKLIADVGLVGFPNAGKSSLLSVVSKAKPRIASFPFTTLRPELGIMNYKDLRQISMADLPGLIEGAHVNRGLGHQFLRHVERTRLILLVVDACGFQLGPQYELRSCIETILLLNQELELYKEDLLDKPAILAVNKLDLEGAPAIYKEVVHFIEGLPDSANAFPEDIRPQRLLKYDHVVGITTKGNISGTWELKTYIRKTLDYYAWQEREDASVN